MFLDLDDVKRLTGYSQKAQQKRVLKTMNIPFLENALGDLLISRGYLEGRLGCPTQNANMDVLESPRFESIGQETKRQQ